MALFFSNDGSADTDALSFARNITDIKSYIKKARPSLCEDLLAMLSFALKFIPQKFHVVEDFT